VLSLSSLAGWEDAVLASIAGATGTVEQRDRQIERSGLYGEYPAILNAYIELLADDESAAEALKRALFLVWIAAMGAPADTGIAALPDASARSVIEEADGRIRSGATDDELGWMLAWYAAEGRFVFELYGATPRLFRFAESRPREAWRSGVDVAAMRGRGQLGRYWAALAAGGR
jgi:hypothetical protein